MKLTLTYEDGTVIEQWNVEEDFGDVSKAMPAALLKSTVCEAINKHTVAFSDAVKALKKDLQKKAALEKADEMDAED